MIKFINNCSEYQKNNNNTQKITKNEYYTQYKKIITFKDKKNSVQII